jgi:hypothetical protein
MESADHRPFGEPQLVSFDMTGENSVLTCAGGRDRRSGVDGVLGRLGRISDGTRREHPDRASREFGTQPGDEFTSRFEPMAYVDSAAHHDGIDVVKILNRARLPDVDAVPRRREALGDDASDLRGCAVLTGCRDENSDEVSSAWFRLLTCSSCLRIAPMKGSAQAIIASRMAAGTRGSP